MGLQFVQIGVVRQVFGKVLIIAEGVQIHEHRVALGLAGVADLQVVGVGEHTHDLGADVLRLVGQIDAVAQGFAHLCLAVGAGQTQAGLVVRQQGRGLHQRLAVQLIEAADDLAGLLQHGQLVLAYGHGVGHEGGDVRRLADGIGQEAHGDAVVKAPQLDLRLHGGVAFQPGQRHQVHVVEGQLRQLTHHGLDEHMALGGVQTAGHVVQRHLEDVLPHLTGVVEIVGQGLGVGDHKEQLFKLAAVLQDDAVAEGAYIVAHVQAAGGAVAGEDDLTHNRDSFLYEKCFFETTKKSVPWKIHGTD